MSLNKQEFDRFKGLLDGTQVNQLDRATIMDALRQHSIERLLDKGCKHIYLLHDPSDLRKPHAEKLEDLGTVRALDGELINGYQSMNTVAVDVEQMEVHLLDHIVYSNGAKDYVKRSELELYQTDQWHQLAPSILKKIYQQNFVNTHSLFQQQAQRCSEQLKAAQTDLKITHIQDREFDDEEYFRFIDQQLGDYFITRVRKSRNSHQSHPTLTPTGKPSKKRVQDKLVDKTFEHSHHFLFDKIRLKKRIRQQAKCLIEWEHLVVQRHRIYTVLRIQFLDRTGKNIFKDPMLLVTNHLVHNEQMALSIYKNYLLRSKIEALFKFLKQDLGWEKARIRDFQSIQNLLALAFFIGGYFYDIQYIIADNLLYKQIANLGGGKGKFTHFYFLKGVAKLCQYRQMIHQLRQMPTEQVQQLMDFCNFGSDP